MKNNKTIFVLAILLLLMVFSCAPGPNVMSVTPVKAESPAGFFLGFWHGFILLFTFIISLFTDKVSVYEVYNVGNWYNFGFLIGAMSFFGGSGGSACKGRKNRDY